MKFIKHIFFMMAIAAMALAVITSWPTKPVSNVSAAVNHLQQEDVFPPTMDTYVASGSQWADNPRGESAGLFVGYGDSEAFDLEKTRTFLQFDLKSLAGKVATGPATLRLYFTFMTAESSGQTMNIEIHKVAQGWNNETTWNNQPPYDPTVIASQQVDTEFNRWIEWQIPQDVIQAWIDDPAQNYGIALVSPNGEMPGTHIRNFTSKDHDNGNFAPELRVSSAVPTPTPTPTHTPTATATATATHTPTATATPTATPRLSLEVNNEPSGEVTAGDEITYTISYSNTSEADITLNNVVITGSIPNNTTLEDIPNIDLSIRGGSIIFNIKSLDKDQREQLSYSVKVNTPTPTATATATPTMTPTQTATATTTMTVIPTNRVRSSTRTSLRSQVLSNLALEPAVEPRMTPTPIRIVNCVTGSSDQTGPVRVCVYNSPIELWLPMVSK